jgi:predicted RNase H-like HicB family nuclease
MAVEMAGRVELESPLAVGQGLNALAIFDGQQWASLCPELDIASAGATSDDAIDSLIQAVGEAVTFAHEHHLEVGHPVPPDELRSFLISSQAPYVGRNFAV